MYVDADEESRETQTGDLTMTTAFKTTETKSDYIQNLKGRLASVMQDLDTMPAARLGSEWHADRCDEVRWLASELERLSK